MSAIVIELPLEDELEVEFVPLVVEPPPEPELPLADDAELLVPAETAEPTETGSAVMTPPLGAETTFCFEFFSAVA
jgi:hypothetical protein